jgi:hypothetical protein
MEGHQDKCQSKRGNFKPRFDYLLSKYVNQKTILKNQSSKGITSSPLDQNRSRSHQSGYASNVINVGIMDVTIDENSNDRLL